MSRKMKLVLKNSREDFVVVKTVNTLLHGIPGAELTRTQVDTILRSADVRQGWLTVEFLGK